MIDTNKLYIVILVSMTLTLIQSHRLARKQKLVTQFSMDLDGIWYAVTHFM